MMSLYSEGVAVPEGFRTRGFWVRPLRETDAEADYEAVMDSPSTLRAWSQSSWPPDDFTLESNRADLAQHEAEHVERVAFTYTVMASSGSPCLGCIYMNDLRFVLEQMGASTEELARAGDTGAYVTFWIRASRWADGMDRRLLGLLLEWLDKEWSFPLVSFGTKTTDPRQQNLFTDHGLVERWRYPIRDTGESFLIYTSGQPLGRASGQR